MTANRVLDFWFGGFDVMRSDPTDPTPLPEIEQTLVDSEVSQRWFRKSAGFDQAIRKSFLSAYEAVSGGEREEWLDSPDSRLAYILVLDQYSRNMFRDDPRAFAADPRAAKAALGALGTKMETALRVQPRAFLLMPLMHSEDLEMQERCVRCFLNLASELTGAAKRAAQSNVGFAKSHRDIIARFGRFPHRNHVLGRESTPEEIEFLKGPGSSF